MDEAQERLLRKTYGEILSGYSIVKYNNKNIYIKHLTPIDQLNVDYLYSSYYKLAIKKGYSSRDDRIKQLIKDQIWAKSENEDVIESLKESIKSLYLSKRKAFRQSDFDNINKQIQDQEKLLLEKVTTNNILIGATAEKFAQKKVDDYVLYTSLYKDKELKNKLFNKEDYDNLKIEEIEELYNSYYEMVNSLIETNIKKVALSQFFQNVYQLAENINQFFGKAVAHLTHYQVQLCAYGNFYKNVLTGDARPPESVLANPDKLEDWFFGQAHINEMLKKVDKDGNEASLVGLTDKDKEFLGIDAPMERVDMKKKLQEAGGEIPMTELMKIEDA